MSTYADWVRIYTAGIDDIVTCCYAEGCKDCPQNDIYYEDGLCDEPEPQFSYVNCDICGESAKGIRHTCHGLVAGDIWHGYACDNCVHYLATGEEPLPEVEI